MLDGLKSPALIVVCGNTALSYVMSEGLFTGVQKTL